MTQGIATQLIKTVTEAAFTVDASFPSVNEPIDPEVAKSLDAFWQEPDHAPLAADLGLPWEAWPAAVRAIEALVTGQARPGDETQWRQVARDSERLARDQPVAAALAALLAAAHWCGRRGDDIVIPIDFVGADPDWGLIALPLARNLAAADAHWAAHGLSRYALNVLESMPARHRGRDTVESQHAFRALIRELDESYKSVVAAAAWDLSDALAADPAARAAFAGVTWCAGDVAHAHALAAQRFDPEPAYVRVLLDHSMRRIPDDVLLRRAWFQAIDGGRIDLTDYDLLTGPMSAGRTKEASEFEFAIGVTLGVSAARVHADVAIGHFSGNVLDEDRRALDAIVESAQVMGLGQTPTFVRMASVRLLAAQEDRETVIEEWRGLARLAAALTDAETWHATADAYDRSLDAPLFYLPADDPATFELLERQRCASLAYWLVAARPALPDTPAAGALLEQESELTEEVRGARLIRQLSILPRHYQYAMMPDVSDLAAPWWDDRQAADRLTSLRSELQALHAELAEVALDYARARVDPCAGLDDLRDALVP